MEETRRRAFALTRHLSGIASVAVLGPGGTSEFSKLMTEVGEDLDVHSGAVRTYRPVSAAGLSPRRHPYMAFQTIAGKPAAAAARMVAAPLLRSATGQAPPSVWRARIRSLPGFPGAPGGDPELEELYAIADEQRTGLEQKIESLRDDREEVLRLNNDLARRLKYTQGELRKLRPTVMVEPPTPAFDPDFCKEVVEKAQEELDRVVLGPAVPDSAVALDQHAVASWAKTAWRALRALHAYAEAQAAGGAGGDFLTWCQISGHPDVIPSRGVVMKESETTDNSRRFRDQRTFAVDPAVEPAGRIYMPAHIRVEEGGYPAPRIHFHDDTRGATGRVHVGWFGDHRDNKSKN